MIQIEAYRKGLEDQLWEVFYTAIRLGCALHYSQAQLEAWAPDDLDRQLFASKMLEIRPYVASVGDKVVGYADLQANGYIDHFFVHGDYQGRGVGAALMKQIKTTGRDFPLMYANVSNTAKPFFEKHGFHVVRKQLIEVRGEHLENQVMEISQNDTQSK